MSVRKAGERINVFATSAQELRPERLHRTFVGRHTAAAVISGSPGNTRLSTRSYLPPWGLIGRPFAKIRAVSSLFVLQLTRTALKRL